MHKEQESGLMAVFDNIRKLMKRISRAGEGDGSAPHFTRTDKHLNAAALMFHVIAADGIVRPEESERLFVVLTRHYGLSGDEAKVLISDARSADAEAVDLYGFTSMLKRDLDKTERIALVEDLWEMVFADNEMHEFEDNVVWRVAELLGVESNDRLNMKRRVLERKNRQDTT
jgi:uncharacterized tellurite resistance protein B-like protein